MASGSSSNNNEGRNVSSNEERDSNSKVFSCNYCQSKFSTQQALAGHQNAHKAERALEKQRKERYEAGEVSGIIQPRFNSPPAFNISTSYFTPCAFRPLGVRMESWFRRQPSISPIVGSGTLSLRDILNPSLVNLKNNIEGGAGVQGMGTGATTSRTEDGAKLHDFLKLGNSSENVGTRSTSAEDNDNTMDLLSNIDGDIRNSKSKDEEEPSDPELDLNLKL